MSETVRPTKKQRELLTFIEQFITEHGYSPSYREIMSGLNYTSVATVALHVNNLIRRGHLRKRDRSARSLEVVLSDAIKPAAPAEEAGAAMPAKVAEEKWLVNKVESLFAQSEHSPELMEEQLDHLYVVVGALRVLGLEGAAQSFVPRLTVLKQRAAKAAKPKPVIK